jgi:hypothetical protein
VGALDLDRLKLLVLDLDELILADLVATAFVFAVDRLQGLGIDELLLEAVACRFIDLPERYPLGRRRCRIEGDWARDEGA